MQNLKGGFVCRILALLIVAMLAPAAGKPAAAQLRYRIIDLGTLGGSYVVANAINDRGQIVGTSSTADGSNHAFRTRPNSPINPLTDNLGPVGQTSDSFFFTSSAVAINSLGQTVGTTPGGPLGGSMPYRTQPNAPIMVGSDLLPQPFSDDIEDGIVWGINEQGDVLAWFNGFFEPGGPFLYKRNNLIDLNSYLTPAGYLYLGFTDALAINNQDQIAGTAVLFPDPTNMNVSLYPTAFLLNFNNGTVMDLTSHDHLRAQAFAISERGQVVGAEIHADFSTHAFRTEPNDPINSPTDDLGTLGGPNSTALAINYRGHVVGIADTSGGASHAFVVYGSVMYDLNNLVTSGTGWVLQRANSINDYEEIVGQGTLNGESRAFLLIPY